MPKQRKQRGQRSKRGGSPRYQRCEPLPAAELVLIAKNHFQQQYPWVYSGPHGRVPPSLIVHPDWGGSPNSLQSRTLQPCRGSVWITNVDAVLDGEFLAKVGASVCDAFLLSETTFPASGCVGLVAYMFVHGCNIVDSQLSASYSYLSIVLGRLGSKYEPELRANCVQRRAVRPCLSRMVFPMVSECRCEVCT